MRNRLLTLLALGSVTIATANAQISTNEFSRSGKWELYGLVDATSILNIFDSNAGVYGGGIGVGYNSSQHFTFNGDLSLSAADFDGGLFGDHSSTVLFMTHVSADWNMLKSRVTPVLSLRLGAGAFGEGTGFALDQTLGLGLRWDAGERLVFKPMLRVGALETTGDHRDGWALVSFSLAVAYKF